MISSRRAFLKVGLAGALVLATAGGIYRATADRANLNRFALDDKAGTALGAIAAVILKGAIPAGAQGVDMAIARTSEPISGLPLTTQKEIQDLFGLLTLAPTRRLLAGVSDWSQASHEEVTAFLEGWRLHRFEMLQSAYHALHDLILGGWYADESTWESIGYPGPMKVLS